MKTIFINNIKPFYLLVNRKAKFSACFFQAKLPAEFFCIHLLPEIDKMTATPTVGSSEFFLSDPGLFYQL